MRRAALLLAVSFTACAPKDADLPKLAALPDFKLTSVTTGGKSAVFDAGAVRGGPWVADFVYTTCSGPCPMLGVRMAALQKSLPSSVALVSFTVDPDEDGPERLRDYARGLGAEPARWRFVTGEKAALYRLLREGFHLATVEDPSAPAGRRVTHSTKFALVDSSMTVRGYYDGEDPAALETLARDAKNL
jgi:protein SCO1/2